MPPLPAVGRRLVAVVAVYYQPTYHLNMDVLYMTLPRWTVVELHACGCYRYGLPYATRTPPCPLAEDILGPAAVTLYRCSSTCVVFYIRIVVYSHHTTTFNGSRATHYTNYPPLRSISVTNSQFGLALGRVPDDDFAGTNTYAAGGTVSSYTTGLARCRRLMLDDRVRAERWSAGLRDRTTTTALPTDTTTLCSPTPQTPRTTTYTDVL